MHIERSKPFTGVEDFEVTAAGASWTLPLNPDEPVFRGHYPGNPILPGIYTMESITQGVEIYFAQQGRSARLKRVGSMRFRAPLVPGAQARIEAAIKVDEEAHEVTVRATVLRAAVKAASAKFVFTLSPSAS